MTHTNSAVPLLLVLLVAAVGCQSEPTVGEGENALTKKIDSGFFLGLFSITEFSDDSRLILTPEALAVLRMPIKASWNPRVNMERPRGGVEIFEKVAPAVVVVRTAGGHGTGFIVGEDGLILTNYHVIENGTWIDLERSVSYAQIHLGKLDERGRVTPLPDPVPGYLLAVDRRRDLALLKLAAIPDAVQPLSVIAFAAAGPRPGQGCAIIGHPSSGMLWTLRQGEVSALGKGPRDLVNLLLPLLATAPAQRTEIENMLATMDTRDILLSSCLANPGDSGGPLVNENGELIGVTFAIPSEAAEQKFTYHVDLHEARTFLDVASRTPLLLVPDAWMLGPNVQLIDPQILAAGSLGPEQLLFDLDRDTPKDLLREPNLEELVAGRRFDAELFIHTATEPRAFYDTDNDGTVDLVLLGSGESMNAERQFQLGPDGRWQITDAANRPLVDPSAFQDADLEKSLVKLMKKLS